MDVSSRIRLTAVQASLTARATTPGAAPLTAGPTAALRIRTETPTAGIKTGIKTKTEAAGGSNGGRIE